MGGVLAIASGVLGGLGTFQQSRAQAASYEAQAQAERMNAELAGINANITRSEGVRAQAQAAEDAYKAQGRQRAALAQGGLLSSPTGLLLQGESQANADDEQLQIGRQTELEALNFKIQRSNALNSAGILKANAKSSKGAGTMGLVGGILSGTAAGYNYHRQYKGLL